MSALLVTPHRLNQGVTSRSRQVVDSLPGRSTSRTSGAGNAGDNLLIAGTTAFDGNPASLAAVMAEWTSDRTYAARVANLRGSGAGPRGNGGTCLQVSGPDVTVFDDGAVDVLTGNSGSDWFFAHRSGGVALDLITDLGGSEVVEELGMPTP